MANQCRPEISKQAFSLISKEDYLLACEILQRELSDVWEQRLREEYSQRIISSELHKAIVTLKQRIIVTTNFDKGLETALDAQDVSETHYRTVISSVGDTVFKALRAHSETYIIKIHGTIDDIRTIVFSRSEYVKFVFGNPLYNNFIENLMLNYTVLFIGFSMADPAIISLMELYALKFMESRPHYIFAPQPVDRNIEGMFKRLRKLSIIKYDASKDHEQLPLLVNELGVRAKERRREIAALAIK